jgi:hypothetical protein
MTWAGITGSRNLASPTRQRVRLTALDGAQTPQPGLELLFEPQQVFPAQADQRQDAEDLGPADGQQGDNRRLGSQGQGQPDHQEAEEGQDQGQGQAGHTQGESQFRIHTRPLQSLGAKRFPGVRRGRCTPGLRAGSGFAPNLISRRQASA